jgi:AcrR family transcriptional regulator
LFGNVEADMAELDRRVRRTRRTLHEALISLVLEQGYERITVQDILDRADVGRSTFYAHFRDKEALLVASFDGMREELRQELDAMTPGVPAADPARPAAVIFEHAHRHRRVYRALCGKHGGDLVHRYLHRLISELLREHLRPHLTAADSDLPVDVVAEFYSNAGLGLLLWWVGQDFPHDPAWLARIYQRLAMPGILNALGHANTLSTEVISDTGYDHQKL